MGLFGPSGYKAASGKLKKLYGENQVYYGSARGELLKGLAALEKGYGDATANAALSTSAAKRRILDREKAFLGGGMQDSISRGLHGSSAGRERARGFYSTTNRDMGELDALQAQQISGLQQARGHALSGGYGGLAELSVNQFGSIADITKLLAQMKFQDAMQRRQMKMDVGMSAINGLGQIGGYAMGGGFGGAGGAAGGGGYNGGVGGWGAGSYAAYMGG